MNSLYKRLSLAFALILLVQGGCILWLTNRSSQSYFLEFTQRINASVAMYLAQHENLIVNGNLNLEAMNELAPQIMIINPSVEVYLLDSDGTILTHSTGSNTIDHRRVSLEPINEFLSSTQAFPVFGDNPRNDSQMQVFSAHPIESESGLLGYVYVVLAGRYYQNLLASIATSHSIKNLVLALLLIFAFSLLSGSIVFFMLTRRLHRLTAGVRNWQLMHRDKPGNSTALHAANGPADEISELAHAYEQMSAQLLSQYTELHQKDTQRRELFANISHDLRTPLTSLQGYLETLQMKESRLDVTDRRRYLTIAHKQSIRLQGLTNQLMELSKLGASDAELQLEKFSVAELASDCIQDFQLEASSAGVTMRIEKQHMLEHNVMVLADIALMQRVFENLLSNALRHSARGDSVTVEIATDPRSRLNESKLLISVTDTGSGIATDDINSVFQRYYRSNTDTPDNKNHAGLGLAIVHSILDLHGTSVNVESALGVGTRVSFSLPISAASEPDTGLFQRLNN